MAVPPVLGLVLRVWQVVWAAILLGTTAAIVAKTDNLLKPVAFALATAVVCFVAAAVYLVVPRLPARRLNNALAGVVDAALSLALAALSVAAAATMGRSETRDVVCKVSDFVNQVASLLQQYLNISTSDGGLSHLCAGAGLAIAAGVMLFVSFLATAALGVVAARQGEGLLPLGKKAGVEGKLSQPPITV